MKKFVLMHCGFEKPTPEVMKAWGKWFDSIKDKTVDNLGFGGGREISKQGVKELSWGPDSITGLSIIQAESLDEAQQIAETNPYVGSIRVYEVRSK